MPKFAANLGYLFTDLPFMDRPKAAAAAGFKAIEFRGPYDHGKAALSDAIAMAGVEMALFNTPVEDWAAGERGYAALPERRDSFRRGFEQALDWAEVLDCKRIHVMAGRPAPDADWGACRDVYIENLAEAADLARPEGIEVLIEIQNEFDNPGYFLTRHDQAEEILEAVGARNLKLIFDCYHAQLMEGRLSHSIDSLMSSIGHVQIAGVPGRHEPDIGEINYTHVFDRLDAHGYAGWVGCEYAPRGDTVAGLGWARAWGIGR